MALVERGSDDLALGWPEVMFSFAAIGLATVLWCSRACGQAIFQMFKNIFQMFKKPTSQDETLRSKGHRSVQTQAPVTYTSLRNVVHPRFHVLREQEHGAWVM